MPNNSKMLIAKKLALRERKQVVLFLSDALRPDHLGCYGYARETSPFLDSLAKEGMVFKNAFACASFTMPSHKAILTSVYDSGGNMEALKPGVGTLAEVLQSKGIITAAFVSNGITSKKTGLQRGFGFFDEGFTGREAMEEKGRNAFEAVDAALRWIEKNRARDFFCFIQVVDTHGPYTPPPEFVEMFNDKMFEEQNKRRLPLSETELGYKSIPKYQQVADERLFGQYVARYDGAVRFVDSALERLWRGGEETALVFTSDHGETMGEHNWFFCHGTDLYEESIRVPLVVMAHGEKTGISEELANHLDIAPTVLGLFGMKKPGWMQGQSLLKPLERKELFFEVKADLHSRVVETVWSCVRGKEWKYLEKREGRAEGGSAVKSAGRIIAGARQGGIALLKSSAGKAGAILPKIVRGWVKPVSVELFNIKDDPLERKNVAGQNKDAVAGLKKGLDAWKKEQARLSDGLERAEKVDHSEEMKKRLKKLGYF